MKYAVAYMNFFDNNLKLAQVDAENPIIAIVEGVRQMTEAPDNDPWLNSFLRQPVTDDYDECIEYICRKFFDADILVAVIPIDS